jgi:hypothetical protein
MLVQFMREALQAINLPIAVKIGETAFWLRVSYSASKSITI